MSFILQATVLGASKAPAVLAVPLHFADIFHGLRERSAFLCCASVSETVERGFVPPCSSEMNSQFSTMLAESLQSRKMAGRNAPVVSVMAGLSELEHFRQGLVAASPLDVSPGVPIDLEFAVKTSIKEKH